MCILIANIVIYSIIAVILAKQYGMLEKFKATKYDIKSAKIADAMHAQEHVSNNDLMALLNH